MKTESSSLIRANSSENCGFLCLLKFQISSKHVFGIISHNLGYFKYLYGTGRMHKVLSAAQVAAEHTVKSHGSQITLKT